MQVPHPPEEGLFLGSAWTLIRKDHHRAFNKWGCTLGPIYAVRVLCWHVRHLCNPTGNASLLDTSAVAGSTTAWWGQRCCLRLTE